MGVRSGHSVAFVCLALAGCAPSASNQQNQAAPASASLATSASDSVISAEVAANQAAAAGNASAGKIVVPGGTLTKVAFGQLVIGHSKAEISDAFGEPSNVLSMAGVDTWFYNSDRLPITDSEAGILLSSVGVTFGSDGIASSIEN